MPCSGFKDTTRTHYSKGGPVKGPKGAAKVAKVMHEFKSGKLHSGSKEGPKVSSPKQAVAIALSEARKVQHKAKGGLMVRRPTTADLERANRDTGGMSRAAEQAAGAAVARGNRASALEAGESALVRRKRRSVPPCSQEPLIRP